jgi:pyruvate,water dikinase
MESFNRAWPKVFADFGVLLEAMELREIGGHVYQRAKPFGVGESGGGKLPPRPVLWLLLRLHPAFRRRTAQCKEGIRGRLDRKLIERWYDEWRPRLSDDIERYRCADMTSLSDEELGTHVGELKQWLLDAAEIHFYLHPAQAFPLAKLAFFCRDHLGYDDGQTIELLSGLSGASSEPALELGKLADLIREDREMADAVLAASARDVADVIAQGEDRIGDRLNEYLNRYCYRALRYEVVEECLVERPELIGSLLQDQIRQVAGLREEAERLAAARAEAKVSALSALVDDAKKQDFLALMADAERAYPVREDNEFFTVSVPLAVVRFAVLEAGKRLSARGAISDPEDVFFLAIDEVVAGLTSGEAQYQEIVGQRREDLAAAEAFDAPASYGEEPPAPPLDVLPPETRLAMEVATYSLERVFAPERSGRREKRDEDELRGIGASKGLYRGPARVVLGEEDFAKLQVGDVLVCPITSPVWSILFAQVGALVTDSGGVLSHPAIIAREYGVPAVVATGNATEIIVDGQEVEVNGEAGVIRLRAQGDGAEGRK